MPPPAPVPARLRACVLLLWVVSLGLGLRQVLHGSHAIWGDCLNAQTDFCVFWGAAKLAIAGRADLVFQAEALAQASGNLNGGWFPWLHPPGTLLALAPLGALPAAAAFGLFTALSIWAVARVFARLAPGLPLAPLVLAPTLLPSLILGQFTLLWVAGLVAALLALGARRPWRAGLLIGLLTLKPTLGLLIPFALLAMGAWRTILAALVTAMVVHGAASLVFGTAYWPQMATAYQLHGATVVAALPGLDRMTSLPALLSQAGLGPGPALMAQSALTLGLIAAILWTWRAPGVAFERKAALLLAAAPLATPYLWYYDAGLIWAAALFLYRAERLPLWALVPFWLGPGLVICATLLGGAAPPASVLVVPLMGLALVAVWAGPPRAAVRPGLADTA